MEKCRKKSQQGGKKKKNVDNNLLYKITLYKDIDFYFYFI